MWGDMLQRPGLEGSAMEFVYRQVSRRWQLLIGNFHDFIPTFGLFLILVFFHLKIKSFLIYVGVFQFLHLWMRIQGLISICIYFFFFYLEQQGAISISLPSFSGIHGKKKKRKNCCYFHYQIETGILWLLIFKNGGVWIFNYSFHHQKENKYRRKKDKTKVALISKTDDEMNKNVCAH